MRLAINSFVGAGLVRARMRFKNPASHVRAFPVAWILRLMRLFAAISPAWLGVSWRLFAASSARSSLRPKTAWA